MSDRRLAILGSLLGLTLLVYAMVAVRVAYSDSPHYGALVWNLRDFAVAPTFYGGSIKTQVPDIKLVRGLNQKGLFDVRNDDKPSVKVVSGRFAAQAAADGR